MKATTVHPLPQAAFTPPSVVCMPKGSAAFTNLSTISNGTALAIRMEFWRQQHYCHNNKSQYICNGRQLYGSVKSNLSFWLCRNSTTAVVSNFAQQPVAAFSFLPTIICQGSDAVFTDESTASQGTINGWYWNFGDGTTSTKQMQIKDT